MAPHIDLSAQPVASTTGRHAVTQMQAHVAHISQARMTWLQPSSRRVPSFPLGMSSGTRRGGVGGRWRHLAVMSDAAATKKKPVKKQQNASKIPPALPGPFQQTLRRSFTVGGLGLHSGEYAYVRVCPAHAGEGRYFVRVPDGSNSGRFQMEEIFEIPRHEFGASDHLLDPDEEALKVQLFSDYLRAEDADEFDGSFQEWLAEIHGTEAAQLVEEEQASAKDEPVVQRGESESYVLATQDNAVEGLPYFTRLASAACEVSSVEHLLAALEACGVDNARIEIEGGSEVPVLDGSTVGWCVEVEKVGLRLASYGNRDKIRKVAYAPKEVITVRDGDAFVQIIPGAQQCVSVGIDHTADGPLIGKQWMSWCPADDEEAFRWEIAPARIYAPSLEYLMDLRRQGLVKGGTSDVAVIADGDSWADNTTVRYFDDEPVRHAITNLVGDLSLLGVGGSCGLPLGHVIAYKATHALHVRFLRALKQACSDDDLATVG